jgi:hypothetical protein
MPSPRGRKNYTLGSFSTEEEEPPIQVYTDSNERIPEPDPNPNNPFYGDMSEIVPEPDRHPSEERTVFVPGGEEVTLEEAERRCDGMVYVL